MSDNLTSLTHAVAFGGEEMRDRLQLGHGGRDPVSDTQATGAGFSGSHGGTRSTSYTLSLVYHQRNLRVSSTLENPHRGQKVSTLTLSCHELYQQIVCVTEVCIPTAGVRMVVAKTPRRQKRYPSRSPASSSCSRVCSEMQESD